MTSRASSSYVPRLCQFDSLKFELCTLIPLCKMHMRWPDFSLIPVSSSRFGKYGTCIKSHCMCPHVIQVTGPASGYPASGVWLTQFPPLSYCFLGTLSADHDYPQPAYCPQSNIVTERPLQSVASNGKQWRCGLGRKRIFVGRSFLHQGIVQHESVRLLV